MQFLKKNWEKVLLGLVGFGLVVAVGFLPVMVANERARLVDLRNSILTRPVKPLESVNLAPFDAVLSRAATPIHLDFSTTNKLFNPVRWLRAVNGSIFPSPAGRELEKLEITKITPLYLVISLESITPSDLGTRYGIVVNRQAAQRAGQRRRQYFVSKGDKKEAFTLVNVKGPPDAPAALVLELPDSDKQVEIAKGKRYERVDGYMADLKYPPDNRTYLNRRVSDRLYIAGEEYTVASIKKDEVVLSAKSNGKKYTIKYHSGP